MSKLRLDLLDFSTVNPASVADEFEQADVRLRQSLVDLERAEFPTFQGDVLPVIHAELACRGYGLLHHLSAVADSPQVREALDRSRELAIKTGNWAMDNEGIYNAYAKIAQSEVLDPWQQAWLQLAMRPYERRGFGLPADIKARLSEITERRSELSTRFGRNLLDTTKAWHLELTPEQVADMPEKERQILAATGARWNTSTGFAVDLLAPAMIAVRTHCTDRQVRETVWRIANQQGTPEGPGGEACSNLDIVLETLALRHEAANLCGQSDFAHWIIQDKMAGTPEVARGLLEDLRDRARPGAQREWEALSGFARTELGLETLQPWDVAFAAERQRQAQFGFSDDEVAAYFPAAHAVDGMLSLSGKLFGVEFQHDADVSTWDPEVRFYRVIENGETIGGFYLDLYARPGKRQGAWKSTFHPRTEDHVPVATLNLNAAAPTETSPGLLPHSELVTLFHEFGHGIHLLLGRSPYSDTDMSGVEHDAIECPSQMMENFAWDPAVLKQLSRHHETGEHLPDALIQSMIDSRNQNVGMFLVRQLTFGLWDLSLHAGPPVSNPEDLWTIARDVRDATQVVAMPEGVQDQTLTAFAHIFSGGYAAGYYGYLWAEVLSADAFDAFVQAEDGPISEVEGTKFRQEILEVGAVRPFSDSFEAFRGRAPSVQALLIHRGLSTDHTPTARPRT